MPARHPEVLSTPVLPEFARTTLPNGVRVVSETVPSVRSVAVGVWVDAGSRDERDDEAGLTHFLEHLVFKGTRKRRGYQINQRMEAVGGYLNAFTTKEHTCFYARGLDEHVERALDTVLDLAVAPILPPREVEKEKDVVIEEMKMVEDTPEDVVFDDYEALVYPDHPLGRPILGTPESVRGFSRDSLVGFLDRHYAPNRLVVALSGNVTHEAAVRATTRLLDGFERAPSQPVRTAPPEPVSPEHRVVARPIQQAHLVLGVRAWSALDERRSALALLHTILGGGMSSRLNQNIREKYGYCYSVYSFLNQQADSGDLGVYIGVDAGKVDRAKKLVVREFERLAEEAVSPQLLARAKQQLKGSILLGLESMSNRMQRLGRVELTFGRYFTLDEVTAEVDAVSAEDVRAAAEALFRPERMQSVAFVPA